MRQVTCGMKEVRIIVKQGVTNEKSKKKEGLINPKTVMKPGLDVSKIS